MTETTLGAAAPLPPSFYTRPTPEVARDLLGAVLLRRVDERLMAGRIVETEAYGGPEDLASHAARSATGRARIMFGPVGRAYVYIIYGMHDCLNVVAHLPGDAGAVLVRALEPIAGVEAATNGPGRLCRALAIDRSLNDASLDGPALRLVAGPPPPEPIAAGTRIGVDYAGEWAARPWRYWLEGNPFVSVRAPTERSRRSRTDRRR